MSLVTGGVEGRGVEQRVPGFLHKVLDEAGFYVTAIGECVF